MGKAQKIPVDWSIQNMDTFEILNPPYPVEESGVRVTVGGVLSEQQRFGFQDPITQWVGGRVKSITFSTTMFAVVSTDRIASEFLKFEKLALQDEKLGRPPICMFALGSGSVLAELCLVESVDPEIMPVRPDGEPRRINLNFTLKKYVPFSQTQVDPSKPSKESYFLVTSAAEASYEAIAKRFYGNPLKGDRLRKRHPDMPFTPTVGRQIEVPSKSIILREVVKPAFHANDLTDEAATAQFEAVLDARNSRKVVF